MYNRELIRRYAGSDKTDSRTLRREAKAENANVFDDLMYRDKCILSSMFIWDGFPETVDSVFFEQILRDESRACVLYDSKKEVFLDLPCFPSGNLNYYQQAGLFRAISVGYSENFLNLTRFNQSDFNELLQTLLPDVDAYKGVVCYDNYEEYPIIRTAEIYNRRIADTLRTIDTLLKLAKMPAIIETSEDSKLAIQQAIQDIDSNVFAVYATRDLAKVLKESKVLNTGLNPSVLDIVWNTYNNLESKKLTAFGINNLNTADKRERLLEDEINSNNESIGSSLTTRLKPRQEFCKNFNAVFPGYNVSVRVNEELVEKLSKEGGAKNGGNIKDTSGGTTD